MFGWHLSQHALREGQELALPMPDWGTGGCWVPTVVHGGSSDGYRTHGARDTTGVQSEVDVMLLRASAFCANLSQFHL